jgi:uncharacterized membrane protein required for colicin V production
MMHMATMPSFLAGAKVDYFDTIAVVWLIIGLFRGRARGMSQELLPLLQWVGIVVAGGLFYWPLSGLVRQYTHFEMLWSVIVAYLLIAAGVHLVYLWFKQMLGTKLVEKDPFGRGEFYLGMMAGVARFACMLLVGLALMNSRVATAAELAQMEKFQAAFFSDIRFPTYGQFQQDVLFKSFTGSMVETHLNNILIASVNIGSGPARKTETIAQQSNRTLDDIIGHSGKR